MLTFPLGMKIGSNDCTNTPIIGSSLLQRILIISIHEYPPIGGAHLNGSQADSASLHASQCSCTEVCQNHH
jgi:hypothetical protein